MKKASSGSNVRKEKGIYVYIFIFLLENNEPQGPANKRT